MLVRRSLDEVFQFFEDPRNLAKITPNWLSFQVISPETVTMKKGAEIEYKIKWLGLAMYWKTLITEYQPPTLFVDEQAKGPYLFWRHRHTFDLVDDGVKVGDRVEYALPLGALGRATHVVLVRRQLVGIFEYRQRKLADIFEGATIETARPRVRIASGAAS
jgi:ligand-binding SRPBCC domain-containing protein